ncbi:MAG: Delta(1)-pyrroline-2-carboxylate reductase [Phycisphaerae bacterium]|nr:Delta(1)-pyrroline-2-carboxylate reductase [Phycisphaerae bacterium]
MAKKKAAAKKASRRPSPQAAKAKDTPAATPPPRPAPVSHAVVHGGRHQLQLGKQLLYLNQADVDRLPWESAEIVNHVRIALREQGKGKVQEPAGVSLFPQRDALISTMPACVPNVQACGIKFVSNFANNQRRGLPQVSGLALLTDPQTGFPVALIDATWLTARSGPAVSAVAASLLARPDSRTAGIIGCGVQGRGHIPALVSVLPKLERIRVYDVHAPSAAAATRGWRGKMDRKIEIEPVKTAADAVRGAEVLVSATTLSDSPKPAIHPDQVRSGALVLALDLDAVFDPDLLERADRLYVDSIADIEMLRGKGLFKSGLPNHLTGELGKLVAEKIPGRTAEAERIVCLTIGVGSVDIVLARAIFEKACRLGVGTVLDL